MASAALNAACFTSLVGEELGRSTQPAVLVQTVPMMEAAIRQRARPAEAQLKNMQVRAIAAAQQGKVERKRAAAGKSLDSAPSMPRASVASNRKPKAGRFSLRTLDKEMQRDQKLDHTLKASPQMEGAQQLSGVHAEAQFNFEGTTFGRLEPRLANETEPEEEEEEADSEPVFMEDAPPGALSFGGKDCTPTEILGGPGVANPYDATFPAEFNQITIEAWVKDCNLMDFNGYIGLHDVRNAPVRLQRP